MTCKIFPSLSPFYQGRDFSPLDIYYNEILDEEYESEWWLEIARFGTLVMSKHFIVNQTGGSSQVLALG